MSWVRTDDALHEHPKIMALGDRAFRVWSRVLHYANRFPKKVGFVSDEVLRRLGATERVREELLRSPTGYEFGLWEKASGGIVIHDFAEYARRREDVSEKRAEAGRKSGEKRREKSTGKGDQPTSIAHGQEQSANDPRGTGERSANDPQTIGERSARPPRAIEGPPKSSESLATVEHFVQQGPRARARDPVPSRPVEEEIPSLRSGASAAPPLALLPSDGSSTKRAPKRTAKHTPDEIRAKDAIVATFEACFEAKKGPKPKRLGDADHGAAFKLAKDYGEAEGCSIIRAAFEHDFVVNSKTSLVYIAANAETYRGERRSTTRVRAGGVQKLVGDEPWIQEAAKP